MRSTVYFVENLTVTVWLSAIWPRLFRNRKRGERGITRCYVIDGSSISLLVARASARLLGVSVERLDFRLMDVRDQEHSLQGDASGLHTPPQIDRQPVPEDVELPRQWRTTNAFSLLTVLH